MTARFSLRQQLRAARRRLGSAQRRCANTQINHALIAHPRFRRARCIALYFAHGGEADVAAAIKTAWHCGKTVLVPRVFGTRLLFLPWSKNARRLPGPFGIPQPGLGATPVPVRRIDVVVTPLVGFDPQGERLGQGGGYYDRMLMCRRVSTWRKPYLIGVAFGLQRVEKIRAQPWDVAMDTVIHDTITLKDINPPARGPRK